MGRLASAVRSDEPARLHVTFTQDQIRRGADVLREAMSAGGKIDTYDVTVRVLEASIKNTNDIRQCLPETLRRMLNGAPEA